MIVDNSQKMSTWILQLFCLYKSVDSYVLIYSLSALGFDHVDLT